MSNKSMSLKCPVCTSSTLAPVEDGKDRLWICAQCKGLLAPGSAFNANGIASLSQVLVPSRIGKRKLHCPNCRAAMECLRTPKAPYAEIDHCGACHAVWLDRGELPAVEHNLRRLKNVLPTVVGSETTAIRAVSGSATRAPLTTGEPQADPRVEQHRLVPADFAMPQTYRVDVDAGGMFEFFVVLLTTIPQEVWLKTMRRPIETYVLLGLVFVLFPLYAYLGPGIDVAVALWGAVPAEIAHGVGLHKLVTSLFINDNIILWLGSLYFVWVFGDNVEDALGRALYPLVCVVPGVALNLAHCLAYPESTVPITGTLGLAAGLMGAYLVLFPASRVRFTLWAFIRPYVLEAPSLMFVVFFGIFPLIARWWFGLTLPSWLGYATAIGVGGLFGAYYRVVMLPKLRTELGLIARHTSR